MGMYKQALLIKNSADNDAAAQLAMLLSTKRGPDGWRSLSMTHRPYKDGSDDIDAYYRTPAGKAPLDLSEDELDRLDAIVGALRKKMSPGYKKMTMNVDREGNFDQRFKY